MQQDVYRCKSSIRSKSPQPRRLSKLLYTKIHTKDDTSGTRSWGACPASGV